MVEIRRKENVCASNAAAIKLRTKFVGNSDKTTHVLADPMRLEENTAALAQSVFEQPSTRRRL